MPELPEVEVTRQGIVQSLRGRVLRGWEVRQPRLRWPVDPTWINSVLGQTLQSVERRSKYLLLGWPAGHFIVHLGMSGSLRVLPAHTPQLKHDHIDWIFDDRVLRFHDPRRFGSVHWVAGPPESLKSHPLLARLGPEPLGGEFDGEHLYAALRHKKQGIKPVLLAGQAVVGVGNIYASESLFRAGIKPQTPAGRISRARCERLASSIIEVLNEAIQSGGSTLRNYVATSGEAGGFQLQARVYGREGAPCVQCGQPIRRLVQAQRATYWCATCQT